MLQVKLARTADLLNIFRSLVIFKKTNNNYLIFLTFYCSVFFDVSPVFYAYINRAAYMHLLIYWYQDRIYLNCAVGAVDSCGNSMFCESGYHCCSIDTCCVDGSVCAGPICLSIG